MQRKYGVTLTEYPGGACLVAQGGDVNIFGENHPLLAGVLPQFKRYGRVRMRHDLVDISSRPEANVILANHLKHRVRLAAPACLHTLIWIVHSSVCALLLQKNRVDDLAVLTHRGASTQNPNLVVWEVKRQCPRGGQCSPYCNVRVTFRRTIQLVREKLVLVEVSGRHVAEGDTWGPPRKKLHRVACQRSRDVIRDMSIDAEPVSDIRIRLHNKFVGREKCATTDTSLVPDEVQIKELSKQFRRERRAYCWGTRKAGTERESIKKLAGNVLPRDSVILEHREPDRGAEADKDATCDAVWMVAFTSLALLQFAATWTQNGKQMSRFVLAHACVRACGNAGDACRGLPQ